MGMPEIPASDQKVLPIRNGCAICIESVSERWSFTIVCTIMSKQFVSCSNCVVFSVSRIGNEFLALGENLPTAKPEVETGIGLFSD
jgi:hypothetical protein